MGAHVSEPEPILFRGWALQYLWRGMAMVSTHWILARGNLWRREFGPRGGWMPSRGYLRRWRQCL